jgi:DNA repair exonuclease SbcCD ATPase subunit
MLMELKIHVPTGNSGLFVVAKWHIKFRHVFPDMGEPRKEITQEASRNAARVLQKSIRELEDDIDNLEDFEEEVADLQPSTQPQQSGMSHFTRTKKNSDTDTVLELYREHFFPEDDYPDQVEVYAEKFDLSIPAADFLDEMMGVANLSDKEALKKVKFLDGSNRMSEMHIAETEQLAKYPQELRGAVIEDTEVEKNSLEKYSREISELEDTVVELNREYSLPMDVDEAQYVMEELEEVRDRVQQLKKRRKHEIRRRPDILDGYFEENLEKFYQEEEYEEPVLEDLQAIEQDVDEAFDNIVI